MTFATREAEQHNCFGCSRLNPNGLKLTVEQESEDEASCRFILARDHESYPGIVHGGITSTVLDELMGSAIVLCCNCYCLTTTLRTRFIEPLRTGCNYQARARVLPSRQGLFRVEAVVTNPTGTVMVSAVGTFQAIAGGGSENGAQR